MAGHRRILWGAVCVVTAFGLRASGAAAQDDGRVLTLEEAIRVAREHNPTYRSTTNDRAAADWGVRQAYAAFLPTASANFSAGYTEGGTQRIGTLDFGTQGTDWYSSNYNLNLNWTVDGATVFGVAAARASQRAVDAGIEAASFDLRSRVTLQYMGALRARDGLAVAQRQLERARRNKQLVDTRVQSGAAAGTEGKQAAVDLGRAEVAVVRARVRWQEAVSLLAEQLGVPLDASVRLRSEFAVFEPRWSREELLARALEGHPSLRAFEARERAARATARQATSQYFPSLSVFTGFRGNTLQALNEDFVLGNEESAWDQRRQNCEFTNALLQGVPTLPGEVQDCGAFAFTEERRRAALERNAAFPFDFTRLPLSVTFQVSIPVFTGFQRQVRVSEAYNAADDARWEREAETLRLRTAVGQAFDNLVAAYEVVNLEEVNRDLAAEQLRMQQRRYALGAASLLELLDAQTSMTTAEQAYLDAVYDFHWNLIRLEAAVGRPLRPGGDGGASDSRAGSAPSAR